MSVVEFGGPRMITENKSELIGKKFYISYWSYN